MDSPYTLKINLREMSKRVVDYETENAALRDTVQKQEADISEMRANLERLTKAFEEVTSSLFGTSG